jgi:hypothetical protein
MPICVGYTFSNVKTFVSFFLLVCTLIGIAAAEETSFNRVSVPDSDGKPAKAVLTLSDKGKAILIQPVKGKGLSIPYSSIDKFVYEYTRKHHVTDKTIATAPIGVGAVAMIKKSRTHWLEIDYHEQEVPKKYVVRMDKRNYLHILEAVKAHTGKDAEILGNADKRKK